MCEFHFIFTMLAKIFDCSNGSQNVLNNNKNTKPKKWEMCKQKQSSVVTILNHDFHTGIINRNISIYVYGEKKKGAYTRRM